MPSSTSSFKPILRMIPQKNWITLSIFAVIFTAGLVLVWEMYWRSQGYPATLNDNKDIWALNREKLDKDPKSTVVIGSSRSLYGFNLYEWQKAFGVMPIQLATVATNPNVYLNHLANETNFSGTLLLGIVPNIFFAPEGAPIDIPTANIRHYSTFSPTQRWSHYISVPLEKTFAFLETEDLSLKNLIKKIPFTNRATAQIPPPVPPFLLKVDENRQGAMIKRVETDPVFQQLIKDIWVNYFTPPPPPKGVSMENYLAGFAKHMEQVLAQARKNIETIQKRGGKVILIRYPSSGNVLRLESTYFPRPMFWDRIVKEVKPDFSVYYDDHEELKGFICPEESHLSPEDGLKFTQGLIKVIGKERAGYL